jgi:class 3 adenylate cyclase
MPLKTELEQAVKAIFHDDLWTKRDGHVVPEPEDVRLGNDAVNLTGTVLYADISDSTKLVDGYKPHFAAEVYKAYLASAARIIKSEDGAITAYDGDRIMAVFVGNRKNTSAVRSAFKINGAVWDIIKPALKAEYPNTDYNLRHLIGIDTSALLISRIGVRNDNDLVWVGRAANYAAKLCSLNNDVTIRVTASVYESMLDEVKFGPNNTIMWEERTWSAMDNMRIYGSTWKFGV